MRRWLLATTLLVVATAAHGQNLNGYHLSFDQNLANGISAGAPGSGATWETSVPYGDLSTGNYGQVNPTAAGQAGSQYSTSGCALNMRVSQQYSPYLDTGPSFSQQFGYFEASIKQGAGGWNAFWLLPNSGPWPPEIDALEGDGSMASFTNHGGDINTPVSSSDIYNRSDLSTGFHTYGLMWTPTTLTWYLDGQAVFSAPTAPNEQQPMKIILSAYNKGGAATSMQVAWVRAYSDDPSVPTVQPAPSGNCPETGGPQSNTAAAPSAPAAASAAPGSPLPQSSPPVAETSPVNQWQPTAPATAPVCGAGSYFTVSMDGAQLGGVRSASGLTTADIPRSYTSAGHLVIVKLFNGDGSPMASCHG